MRSAIRLLAVLAALSTAGPATARAGDPAAADPVARGEYVFDAAGCVGCHTEDRPDAARLAGGRALATPFGTFYGPNITPDPATGIGRWDAAQFRDALRHGVGADGAPLFPAFPYPSFTGMRDGDIADLWAYLRAQPPVARPNRPHDLRPPFGWRFLLRGWQALYLQPGPLADDPARPADWNRGRYLVEALGHCGECHTPRGRLGGLDGDNRLAGSPAAADGRPAPNLTPHESGLADWSEADIAEFLASGMTPDGDFAGGAMAEVIRNSTARLTDADRAAVAVYLKSLPPKVSAAKRR